MVQMVQMILQRWRDSYKLLIEVFPRSSRLVIEVDGKGMEVEGLRRIVGDRGHKAELGTCPLVAQRRL